MKFLATKLQALNMVQNGNGKPVSEWAKEHIGGLQTVHCENIILCECIVLSLIEAPSKRWNGGSLGVFSTRTVQRGEVLCLAYGAIVYRDFTKQNQPANQYGENDVHGCTSEMFCNCSYPVELSKRFRGVEEVYIVPAQFGVAIRIRLATGTRVVEDHGLWKARTPNVSLCYKPTKVADLNFVCSHDAVYMVQPRI